jgi:hypothetical protein
MVEYREELLQFVLEAQKEKMKELWDDGDYTAWEYTDT